MKQVDRSSRLLVFTLSGVLLGAALAGCSGNAVPPLTPSEKTHTSPKQTALPRPTSLPGTIASVPVRKLGIDSLPLSGGQVQVRAISCWSAGDCIAGGTYSPSGHTYTNGFLTAESGGRWSTAFLVPGLDGLDVGGDAEVDWVSCSQRGFCGAGGVYDDDVNAILVSFHLNAFVVNEVRGTWYRAIPIPGLRVLNKGDSASLEAGTCAAVGDCQVVGTFLDANSTFQLYTDQEVSGVWQTATQLGQFGEFDPRGSPSFSEVTCLSVSDCTATGHFSTSGTFLAAMHDGVWSLESGG